ncbi:hypothetical protein V7S43_003867 [Phytophthora oleae]|uniref:Uncharacterized protein n=1 Tax=Phytophthora oleae TaxID=2107226 RepID=A0ABD3FVA5_9STRA
MVIYVSTPTVGGVVQEIDLGVGVALLYNFGVFLVLPITQGELISRHIVACGVVCLASVETYDATTAE